MKQEDKGKKVLLFYNPSAGNSSIRIHLDAIIERCQKEGLLVVPVRAEVGADHRDDDHTYNTGYRGALDSTLARINQNDYRQIMVAGGDGTINVCVNAMIRNGIDLPLSIFPYGTSNDFAQYFEMPRDIDELLDIALGDNFTTADVGKANDKYFINVASMGSMVDVSQKTPQSIKNIFGMLPYYLRGLQELPKLKPIMVRITSKEHVLAEEIFFMFVLNGRSMGGMRNMAPRGTVNDGLLDVVVVKHLPLVDYAPLIFEVLQGVHENSPYVTYFQTKEITVESKDECPTDVDGDIGSEMPMHFSVLPGRLKISTRFADMEGIRVQPVFPMLTPWR